MSDDNLLERAFMARVRAVEYAQELNRLQKEFDERPDVLDLKRRIERCEVEVKETGVSVEYVRPEVGE